MECNRDEALRAKMISEENLAEGQSSGTNKARKRKPAQPDTFWTLCNQCKFHYEFVRLYINRTLLCDTCKKPFSAKETAPPPDYLARKEPREKNKVSGDVANKEKVPHSGTANVGSRDHPTGAKACAKGNVPVGPQEQIKRFKLDGTGRASRVIGFSGTRDISLDYRPMLLEKAREDIQIRLNRWKSEEEDSLEN